ncbi:hypothetical protein [Arthrobacter sp. UYEF6]|uniref:hypothetical protein n=1 Tax=Pseudarthrobacter sp. S6 TaxID=3418420 RepID=UPI003398FBDE
MEPATPLYLDGRRDGMVARLDSASDEAASMPSTAWTAPESRVGLWVPTTSRKIWTHHVETARRTRGWCGETSKACT